MRKILSTSNRSGYVTDLDGNQLRVYALSETTYGEPAGLWGINCGHSCNVFIPGLSTVRGEVPPKDENDKRYAESQQQRHLEREVRYAKRDAAVANASGDKESFDRAALKVKQTQTSLNDFLKQTGRNPSLTRTEVVGYNKSVSGKVTASVEAQKKAYANLHSMQSAASSGSSLHSSALSFAKRDDADKLLRPDTEALWSKMSKHEKLSAYKYTQGSGAFNRPLRGYDKDWYTFKGVGNVPLDNEGAEAYINGLTSTINKTSLKQDMWLYRGSNQQSLAGLLGIDESKIVPSNVAALNRKFAGKPISDNAFFSTGVAADAGFKDKIAYEILAPKGTKGIYSEPFSHYGGTNQNGTWDGMQKGSHVSTEAEMILQRGTKFKVIEIKNVGGKVTAVLEVKP